MAFQERRLRQYRGDVDKSLFATKKAGDGLSTPATSAVASQEAVVLSRSDLLRMQGASVIISPSETQHLRAMRDSQQATQRDLAQQRKERMIQLDKERTGRAPTTEAEKRAAAQRDLHLSQARQAMDEELDDVKQMNQMALYAKCVTIRDAQILEKQRRKEEELQEDRRLDNVMELKRLRELKVYEDRDKLRAAEQKIGSRIIIQQMQEREAERIRQEEVRQQEAAAMVARIKELEAKAEQDRLAKLAAGRRLLAEVTAANNEQARQKLLRKQEELEEDARIAEYLRAKEARELALEEDQKRIAHEREKEVARLRAAQERAQDRQSQIDELRARRYQEEKDRQWREQQLAAAEKAARVKQELAASREEQRLDKARQMAELALQEREEFARIMEHHAKKTQEDALRQQAAAAAREEQRALLQAQMAAKDQQRRDARRGFTAEGDSFTAQTEADRAKLLRIKQMKLAELEAVGVPEKYRAQLARKKVLQASIY